MNRATPAPWIAKIDGEFYPAKYYFTVDYTDSEIADDPAQHKQSHVLELMEAGEYTGNIVALPNNRVRVTHPAWFGTGKDHLTLSLAKGCSIQNKRLSTFGILNESLTIYIQRRSNYGNAC